MIRVTNLTKRFGSTLAVDDVSFGIEPGEIVGFLGANGAGKSTLLKMLSTWLPPTSGQVTIDGHDTVEEPLAVRLVIGYLTEHNALYDGMRVDRFLRFVARARGLDGKKLEDRLAWSIEQCDLGTVLRQPIAACSKGFRQRIGVAAAIVHDPPVLLLDEPTHGLDPLQVAAFLDFVRGLAAERAILFSGHVLSEVTAVAKRLLILNHGQLCFDGPVQALEERAAESGATLQDVVLEIVRDKASST